MATFLKRVTGAALLNAAIYEEVERDRAATLQAMAVVALSSAAAGIGAAGLAGTRVTALVAISLFAFFHILIGPTSGYVSELSPQGFLAALGVFAAFGALSIGTWLYFRFRTPRAVEAGG